MKSKKKIVLAGVLLLAITGLLALTSCKNDSVPPEAHTHTFGDWEVETESTDIAAGKLVKKCTTCSEPGGDEMEIPAGFVYIPAGKFQMGSTAGYADEKPDHGVTISKGYFMGRHEVTQKEWAEVMKGNANGISESPSNFKNSPAENEDQTQRPVEQVSWYDAVVYCNRRSIAERLTPCYAIDGETDPSKWGEDGTVPTSSDSTWNGVTCNWNANGYRLPTEAEWEYAARAGDDTTNARTWSGTDTETKLKEYAWYSYEGSDSKIHQVGTKVANGLNLHDMSGNVWEWCWDWYGDYSNGSVSDPHGGSSGNNRVRRGGGWSSDASNCTVSDRFGDLPFSRYNYVGFRLVRSAN